jgi:hypothetical protein
MHEATEPKRHHRDERGLRHAERDRQPNGEAQ